MANDSSDDEMYSGSTTVKSQFPWHTPGYKVVYDQVSMEGNYEYTKAAQSDNFVKL